MEGQFIDVDGTRTYYLDEGVGPTVVLLHGYALGVEAYNTWFRTIESLQQNFRVITFDQIGSGRTDMPRDGRYKARLERVDHALGFLRAMGIEGACLVGHSEGAFLAARIAIVAPGVCSSLVIVTSGGTAPNLGEGRDSEWIAANAARYNDAKQFLDEDSFIEMSAGLRKRADRVYEEKLRAGYRRAKESGAMPLFADQPTEETNYVEREKVQQRYILPYLKNLDIPILLVWATEDPGVVVERGLKLLDYIPGAQMHIFADAGHNVMHDRAADFNRVLSLWCAPA